MKEFLDEYLEKILNIIIVILAISIIVILVFDIKLPKEKEEEVKESNDVALVNEVVKEEKEEVKTEEVIKYYVDIKGAVKKPGVYEVSKGMIINDVIKLAGGLKSNASTKYLNLSKQVSNEMVINIFTTSEIKALNVTSDKECVTTTPEINDCSSATVIESNNNTSSNNGSSSDNVTSSSEAKTDTTTQPTTSKVNINTASLNELMGISGIGEAKAKAIIEYRNTKGKFKTIEDIKNVSGIGEALYEKIKNSITI